MVSPTDRRRHVPTVVAALAALCVVALGAPPSQADDTYMPPVDSACDVTVSLTSGRMVASIEARMTGNVPMTGAVRVVFAKDEKVVDSRTIAYRGGRQTVTGPSVDGPGRYTAQMRFEPDGPTFVRSCSAAAGASGAVLGESGENPVTGPVAGGGPAVVAPAEGVLGEEAGDGGLLPGTGGPALWLLVLAVSLVLGGAAVLVRRRDEARVRW